MNIIIKEFFQLLAIFLVFMAVSLYRKEDSKIKLFSKKFWVTLLIVCFAMVLFAETYQNIWD